MNEQTAKPGQKIENPLGTQPIGKLLVTFSVPAIISCLINSLYNIVDQIFIGQGVGYLGNAATTVAFPLMTILLAFGTLIGSGSSAHAAIRLGEKNEQEARQTLNNAFSFTIVLSILIMILGLIFLQPILTLFGATDTLRPYALEYGWIIGIGLAFVMSLVLLYERNRLKKSHAARTAAQAQLLS